MVDEILESNLLDAYSNAVIQVVDKIGPTVSAIRVIRRQMSTLAETSGSGLTLAPDGYVLTNSHVVRGAESIRVDFANGQSHIAEMIGEDLDTDLAVIRVPVSGLTPATLSDSDILRVGQLIISVGNPVGFQASATVGVVTSLGRSVRNGTGHLIENIVQTDAVLNPGSSGGPLVNSKAQVIGINTVIVQNIQGICFAIPSNTVRWVSAALIRYGKVTRGFLGMVGHTIHLEPKFIREYELHQKTGVRVMGIARGSAARRAGLREGDDIVRLGSTDIHTIDDLNRVLGTEGVIGQSLIIKVVRQGQGVQGTIIPEASPSSVP